jgi:tRNA A37 threonylcarbamoyladenosine dehydratase
MSAHGPVPPRLDRNARLLGLPALDRLVRARVVVLGLGGVGSYTAEALARAGVGRLLLVDHDLVDLTNINRQVLALHSTLGKPKAEVMRERILDINPEAEVFAIQARFDRVSAGRILSPELDYVVDAIDSVSAKLELILRAKALGLRLVSAMGAGDKLDPTRLELADIADTGVCPLARTMRRELRKRGVDSLKVVYSRETPHRLIQGEDASGLYGGGRRSVPGSISFIPAVAGLLLASAVVRDLLGSRIE